MIVSFLQSIRSTLLMIIMMDFYKHFCDSIISLLHFPQISIIEILNNCFVCQLQIIQRITGVPCGAGTAKHLRAPPVFREVSVAKSSVFSVVFCRPLFVFLAITYSHCVIFLSSGAGGLAL